jgi:hypothetical protein
MVKVSSSTTKFELTDHCVADNAECGRRSDNKSRSRVTGLIQMDNVGHGVTDNHSNERGATLQKQFTNTHEAMAEHLHFVGVSVKNVFERVQVKCNEESVINRYQNIELDLKVTEEQAWDIYQNFFNKDKYREQQISLTRRMLKLGNSRLFLQIP